MPCPGCDAVKGTLGPLGILSLGVALGAAFGVHGVTIRMCSEHRHLYVMAMAGAAVAVHEAK